MTSEQVQKFLIKNKERIAELFGAGGFGVKNISTHENNYCFVLSMYLTGKKPIICPAILVISIEEEQIELSVDFTEDCGKATL